ncbi:MAG: hypothetical protein GVY08_15130 [Bacteroidetes bacterium]|jgi:hypothetical protein|nr:hypothetical protein [Bacteroidota bacterium]
MADRFEGKKLGAEGYVYNSYGDVKYLKHAIASVTSLRRYDTIRPVAIFCSPDHADILKNPEFSSTFDHVFLLPEKNRSITGFKHSVCDFMPFERNLYLDGDIVACRNPNRLWKMFSAFGFTITGNHSADNFFGGPKGPGIVKDILFGRRKRTLKRFGLTYLPRIQSGVMYAADHSETESVCKKAAEILTDKAATHFRSRTEEHGRSEESCEWSLAMAMAILEKQVYPWFNCYESAQLDFIENFTDYDRDFTSVSCLYYTNKFIYNFRGIPTGWIQKSLINLFSLFPGRRDYLYVTPYFLHFGWYHQKKPFYTFAERIWNELRQNSEPAQKELEP